MSDERIDTDSLRPDERTKRLLREIDLKVIASMALEGMGGIDGLVERLDEIQDHQEKVKFLLDILSVVYGEAYDTALRDPPENILHTSVGLRMPSRGSPPPNN